jgi:hypothetical protein
MFLRSKKQHWCWASLENETTELQTWGRETAGARFFAEGKNCDCGVHSCFWRVVFASMPIMLLHGQTAWQKRAINTRERATAPWEHTSLCVCDKPQACSFQAAANAYRRYKLEFQQEKENEESGRSEAKGTPQFFFSCALQCRLSGTDRQAIN